MDTSNTCKDIKPFLDAYHDQELPAAEAARVKAHLEQCAACSTRLAETARLVQQLKTLPHLELPADFANKFDVSQPVRKTNVIALPVRIWAPVGVAAAVALVLAIRINTPVANAPGQLHPPVASAPSNNNMPKSASRSAETSANQSQSQPATQPEILVAQALDKHSSPHAAVVSTAPHQHAPHVLPPEKGVQVSSPAEQTSAQAAAEAVTTYTVADLSDTATTGSLPEALGIATDEDGLYEIKM
jgi:hypothetical protein